MNILLRLLINVFAVMAAAYLLPGIRLENFLSTLLAVVALAAVNIFLKPIAVVLTLPITILTLGLFYFVINAFMVMLAGWLVPGFAVTGFISAFLFSLVFTIIKFALEKIFSTDSFPRK